MPGSTTDRSTANAYVLDIAAIDQTQTALAGGKGANLGELARLDGIQVPPGFVVTTHAYRRIAAAAPSLTVQLAALARLAADDRPAIGAVSAAIRQTITAVPLPDDITVAITAALVQHGTDRAYAVRSSATAEDQPTASFAGQQDTYLNVIGRESILAHIRRCWASLYTERAVTYRRCQGIPEDQELVSMAVVVQRMVQSQAAGVLFTADPVSGHRRVAMVEASLGLGEALVSGLVTPDVYRVRDGAEISRTIGAKQRVIRAAPGGGTSEQPTAPADQASPALTDAQVIQLVALGRRIEAHVGRPQDIEWCLADDQFQIVQSRPITTLFPVPTLTRAPGDGATHVYLSVGHQQMMTDPMRPLGISLWQHSAGPPMHEAGGRLFVDITAPLSAAASRAGLLAMIGKSDPLMGDALRTLLERGDVIPPLPPTAPADAATATAPPPPAPAWPLGGPPPALIAADPTLVPALIARNEASLAALAQALAGLTGPALLDAILADIPELKQQLTNPASRDVIMAGMEATWWLNDHLAKWLGEPNAADPLAQSVPHNATAAMGLALLDVADAIRPYPEVVAYLSQVTATPNPPAATDSAAADLAAGPTAFLDTLPTLAGGAAARDAIVGFLDQYGVRGVGEIDITRPRWREQPATLVPVILSNIAHFAPGAAAARFAAGEQAATAQAARILNQLRTQPDGEQKAAATQAMIDRVRTFNGYREYPKFGLIRRYAIYKEALLAEAARLTAAGVLRAPDDIFFLTLPELRDVAHTRRADAALIDQRRIAFATYAALTPPRALTSDGEALTGAYRRDDLPVGALAGLSVSAGTVEGRARVIDDLATADLAPGDILVTAFTDPSWTPLFIGIAGLVTEVGGLMTHGAVIAREYGLPAVVGVEHATRLIRDGQRVRVHVTAGYVERLD